MATNQQSSNKDLWLCLPCQGTKMHPVMRIQRLSATTHPAMELEETKLVMNLKVQ